jgi:hypothetical protein
MEIHNKRLNKFILLQNYFKISFKMILLLNINIYYLKNDLLF